MYAPPALIHGTRTCAQLHSDVGRTLVPPSAASGRVGCGFASVHRLPHPRGESWGVASVQAVRHAASRWGAESPAPGRHEDVCYLHILRDHTLKTSRGGTWRSPPRRCWLCGCSRTRARWTSWRCGCRTGWRAWAALRHAAAPAAAPPGELINGRGNCNSIAEAYRLNFSIYQSGIDFKSPYSNRPLNPLNRLWQGLFGEHKDLEIPTDLVST
jgi:hypothetical protein